MPNYERYEARWVYVVTFHKVLGADRANDCGSPRNTLQMVLTTDNATLSFAIFYYDELNWLFVRSVFAIGKK